MTESGNAIVGPVERSSDPPDPGLERLRYGAGGAFVVSILIPTRDRERGGLLRELLDDLRDQTLSDFEVLLIVGDRRQGRAINRGARNARGRILVTLDDDTRLGTTRLLENLVAVLDQDPTVGMVGSSTVLPPAASWFQRVASRQIPRRLFPIVEELTDSDMVQHPCLAMRRSDFLELGGEDEDLVRGLDPILRQKVRSAGRRVVIAPHTYVSHLLPESFWGVVRMYFRNGRGSAFAQKNYPDRVLQLGHGHEGDRFAIRRSPFARWSRYPLRWVASFVTGKWIRLAVELSYAVGYAREWIIDRPLADREPLR